MTTPGNQDAGSADLSRLALGGAQFGLPYGISNITGAIGRTTARDVLTMAAKVGIRTIDTAMSYGNSEEVLGSAGAGSWTICTKLPPVPPQTESVSSWVKSSVQASLKRLRADHLDTLFLHEPSDLLGSRGPELRDALEDCRSRGVTKRVGASIYDPVELEKLLPLMTIDAIQAPFNLLDQRLVTSGALQHLRDLGIAVHVRSIFLQGLLLMDRPEREHRFPEWKELWNIYDDQLKRTGASPLKTCLCFGLSVPGIEHVVVGVSSCGDLAEIITAASSTTPLEYPDCQTDDMMLIDPRQWGSR